MPLPLLALAVLGAALLYTALTYNRFVSLRNSIRNAWSNVDTELRRRYDLIPNLVAAVRGYAAHERAVLEQVAALRARCVASRGAPSAQAVDENELVAALRQMLLVVERYPDLKADRHFLDLMHELANTEDRIQAARRFFNGNVRDYRNLRESFPSNLLAAACRFPREEFFDVPSAVREAPDVSLAGDDA